MKAKIDNAQKFIYAYAAIIVIIGISLMLCAAFE